jgi:acyl carrier protein
VSVSTVVRKLIAATLQVDPEQLTPETRFDELGRTSFQEVELFTEIEDRFGMELDFPAFSRLATVGELADAVAATVGEPLRVSTSS